MYIDKSVSPVREHTVLWETNKHMNLFRIHPIPVL